MEELLTFSNGFLGDTKGVKECLTRTSLKLNLSEDEVAKTMMEKIHQEIDKCIINKNKPLFDYQKYVVSRFYLQRGIIAAFATGTGKTLTATSSAACVHNLSKLFGKPCKILIVTPASLVDNMKEEFAKHPYSFGKNNKDLSIISSNIFRDMLLYRKNLKQGVTTKGNKFMELNEKRSNEIICNQNTFLIIDEAHEFKTDYLYVFAEEDPRAKKAEDVESRAKMFVEECYPLIWKVLLLSATPMLNKWFDVMNLVAAVKGVDPRTQRNKLSISNASVNVEGTTFGEAVNVKTIPIEDVKIVDENYFRDVIAFKDVDKTNKNFPTRNPEVYVPVYMTPKYFAMVKELLSEIKTKRPSKKNMTEDAINKELEALQKKLAFLPDNPKIAMVKEILSSGKYDKVIIYSRFLNPLNGLKENIEKDIASKKIPHYNLFIITGKDIPPSKRQAYLQKINSEKKAVVFVSDAGGMGLDFKGLEAAIIYEPGINVSREEQAIGRAVRFASHIKLPLEKQRVDIYKFIMRFPTENKAELERITNKPNKRGNKTLPDITPDQSVAIRAKSKELSSLLFRERLESLNKV